MVETEPGPHAVRAVLSSVPVAADLAAEVYDALVGVVDDAGPATLRVSRTQLAFRRRTGFCWLWLPGAHLGRPLPVVVVSVALDHPDDSPRWKQVVRVGGRRWMHHLEVRSAGEVDEEVARWVAQAYELAG
jgi:hypothetical protein